MIASGALTGRFALIDADSATAVGDFARDVADGLAAAPKQLPCMYFYDEQGSLLFEQIWPDGVAQDLAGQAFL